MRIFFGLSRAHHLCFGHDEVLPEEDAIRLINANMRSVKRTDANGVHASPANPRSIHTRDVRRQNRLMKEEASFTTTLSCRPVVPVGLVIKNFGELRRTCLLDALNAEISELQRVHEKHR